VLHGGVNDVQRHPEKKKTLIIYPFFDILAFTKVDKSFEEGKALDNTRTELFEPCSRRALNPKKSNRAIEGRRITTHPSSPQRNPTLTFRFCVYEVF
jgi:hypothetical protein